MNEQKYSICAIVAYDKNLGIGKNGLLPWYIPEDLKRFSTLTKKNIVIMGRKTFDSLPEKFKPLPLRLNIVVSRSAQNTPFQNTFYVTDLTKCISSIENGDFNKILKELSINGNKIWIIGGGEIYKIAIPFIDELYVTELNEDFDCDTFFPDFKSEFEQISNEKTISYNLIYYKKKSSNNV